MKSMDDEEISIFKQYPNCIDLLLEMDTSRTEIVPCAIGNGPSDNYFPLLIQKRMVWIVAITYCYPSTQTGLVLILN
jgi:hypothetical protein